jgi:hypothetical protein
MCRYQHDLEALGWPDLPPPPSCEHPAGDLAWSAMRPLFCTLCNKDLQTNQPITMVEIVHVPRP